jgi:hypothetical protein
MSREKVDKELNAISAIIKALDGLEGETIQRVFDYVLGRLSITRTTPFSKSTPVSVVASGHTNLEATPTMRRASIRDLKEEKNPESSNQMAALVAYYLSEIAPEGEGKMAISSSDLEKYFKQAGFKLPRSIPQTLPNATAAGYFDAEGNGKYRLNAVGYNLIAHGLPRDHSNAKPVRKKSKKKVVTK